MINTPVALVSSGFSLGVLVGYLINRNWYLIRSVLGIKTKRPERKEKKPAPAASSKNSDDSSCGSVDSSGENAVN